MGNGDKGDKAEDTDGRTAIVLPLIAIALVFIIIISGI
jgi:hypothetical protein